MAPGARQRAAVALPALRRARLRLEAGVLQMLEGAPGDHELTSSTMMTSSPVVVRGPVALPIDGAPPPLSPVHTPIQFGFQHGDCSSPGFAHACDCADWDRRRGTPRWGRGLEHALMVEGAWNITSNR